MSQETMIVEAETQLKKSVGKLRLLGLSEAEVRKLAEAALNEARK